MALSNKLLMMEAISFRFTERAGLSCAFNAMSANGGMARIFRTIAAMAVAASLGAGGVYAVNSPEVQRFLSGVGTSIAAMTGSADCRVKGNVSINGGERIYHVPGQLHYTETKIDARYGERWFCSEAEARSAGWRKSRV